MLLGIKLDGETPFQVLARSEFGEVFLVARELALPATPFRFVVMEDPPRSLNRVDDWLREGWVRIFLCSPYCS